MCVVCVCPTSNFFFRSELNCWHTLLGFTAGFGNSESSSMSMSSSSTSTSQWLELTVWEEDKTWLSADTSTTVRQTHPMLISLITKTNVSLELYRLQMWFSKIIKLAFLGLAHVGTCSYSTSRNPFLLVFEYNLICKQCTSHAFYSNEPLCFWNF